MARTLKAFSWEHATRKEKGESKYPWNEWADGQVWKLTRGRDFKCQVTSMQVATSVQAKKMYLKARTRIVDQSTIVIQFSDSNGKFVESGGRNGHVDHGHD